MKIRLLYIMGVAMLLVMFGFDIQAQERVLHEVGIVDVKKFEQQGADLSVEFALDLEAVDIPSKQKVVYTPRLVSPANSVSLPVIIIEGRNNYKSSIRMESLMSKKDRLSVGAESQPYSRIMSFDDSVKVVNYSYSIPYESWMASAMLTLDRDVECRCGDLCEHKTTVLSDLAKLDLVPSYAILPDISCAAAVDSTLLHITGSNPFMVPLSSYDDELKNLATHSDNDALKFYFKLNQSTFDKQFMTNEVYMSNLMSVIAKLNMIPNLSISRVLIAGFASVEGPLALNEQLSYKRAVSISNYLQNSINLDSAHIEIYNGGENWIGLRDIVSSSDMRYRAEVLDIIDKTPVRTYVGRKLVDGRNYQLMQLKGGAPYRYLLKHIFPRLRQAGSVKVYFDRKPDSVAPIIHQANIDIDAGRYDIALSSLLGVSHDPRSYSVLGVCYMMMGDFEPAKLYLQRSIDRGDVDSQKNMDQIVRREKSDK